MDNVVDYTAKVQIFEQITTRWVLPHIKDMLLIIPQRYKFSSKSQQWHWQGIVKSCCWLYRKGTNFRANHNEYGPASFRPHVVDYTAKVQIFEQITTSVTDIPIEVKLLIIPQRYKFSSKSQRVLHHRLRMTVVDYTAKVQIFEQITTAALEEEVYN